MNLRQRSVGTHPDPEDPYTVSRAGTDADTEEPYIVSRARRIDFLPNLVTAGNQFCGFMAIVQCIQARLAETAATGEYNGSPSHEHYELAVWFIFGAAAFDVLDGR